MTSLMATPHDPGCKRLVRLPSDVKEVFAEFSPCRQYRHKLLRRWGAGPALMFAGMNPSGAGEKDEEHEYDDNTVAKMGRLARKWGYGALWVANACDYRAKDKNRLMKIEQPCSPRNIEAIREMASDVSQVVIAHGSLPGKKLQIHADAMCNTLQAAGHSLYILRLSKHGNTPQHPLYIPETIKPSLWKQN